MLVISGTPSSFNIQKSMKLTIVKKEKNYRITLIEAEKEFHKMQHSFLVKNIKLSRKRRDHLNLIKVIYKNPTTNMILNDERLSMSLLRSGTRQGLSFPASVHGPGVLTQCNHARNQGHTGEERSEIVFM